MLLRLSALGFDVRGVAALVRDIAAERPGVVSKAAFVRYLAKVAQVGYRWPQCSCQPRGPYTPCQRGRERRLISIRETGMSWGGTKPAQPVVSAPCGPSSGGQTEDESDGSMRISALLWGTLLRPGCSTYCGMVQVWEGRDSVESESCS